MSLGAMASSATPPRGRRARHAVQWLHGNPGGPDRPSILGVWPTSCNRQEGQTEARESDCCEVPMKRGNARRGKAATTLSLLLGKHELHTGVGEDMVTVLARIAEIAKNKPEEKFTSLYHHVNVELLLKCHRELPANKAAGVDQVTKAEYEANLTENLNNLGEMVKQWSYSPQPVR